MNQETCPGCGEEILPNNDEVVWSNVSEEWHRTCYDDFMAGE